MKKIILVSFLFLTATSIGLFATTPFTGIGTNNVINSITSKVKSFYVNRDNGIYIVLETETAVCDLGGNTSVLSETATFGYLYLDTNDSRYRDILSLLMYAQSNSFKVFFKISPVSPVLFNRIDYIVVPAIE